MVASAAEGGLRDAESILDQLLVYCDDVIRQEDVAALLGLVPRGVIAEFSTAILAEDLSQIIRLVGKIIDQGWNPSQFLSSLINHFRDLLVISVTGTTDDLTDIPAENSQEMIDLSREFTGPRLLFILNELIQEERTIKYAISERVALEMILIKVAQSRGRIYLDNLVSRLEELEAGLPAGQSSSIALNSGEYMVREAAPEPPRSIREIWPSFMETLGANRPMLKTYLGEGEPGEIEDGVLTVYFNEEFDFQREALESSPKRSYMENLLTNKLGFPVKLAFTVRADGNKHHRVEKDAPSSPAKKTVVRKNPLIKSAIEIFDGTIVDIKE